MVRSVIISAVIWCVVLSAVLLYGAWFYQKCCYIARSVNISAVIWCVVLSIVLLYGA
jgi:hypothetical protein